MIKGKLSMETEADNESGITWKKSTTVISYETENENSDVNFHIVATDTVSDDETNVSVATALDQSPMAVAILQAISILTVAARAARMSKSEGKGNN